MKVAYAFRRAMYYPYTGAPFLFPPREGRSGWLKQIRSLNFDGIEVGVDAAGPEPAEASVRELRRELDGEGVPCVAVRGGGGLSHPRTGADNRQRMEQTVRFASWIGASVANMGVGTGIGDPRGRGAFNWGENASQGGSRTATEADFQLNAAGLREVGAIAADGGIDIAIEVHQHSIVDNSWSALRLLELVDHPNVGINPDLGNIYWTYDIPEESTEAAIVALAPKAKYWHCKNLFRLHMHEHERSMFIRVPLPDGDIDYRFAITAMHLAGYEGYAAVEGLQLGDQLTADGKSCAYIRQILKELNGPTVTLM